MFWIAGFIMGIILAYKGIISWWTLWLVALMTLKLEVKATFEKKG